MIFSYYIKSIKDIDINYLFKIKIVGIKSSFMKENPNISFFLFYLE